jgi:hypothetical protein
MIAAACLRTLLATLVVSSTYAFAPLTRSHETSATPSCVACAFLADRIQQELPARVPAASATSLLHRVATAMEETTAEVLAQRWAYNVDAHRIEQAPSVEAKPEPIDFDAEPETVIRARLERREQMGLQRDESPWKNTVMSRFVENYWRPKLHHHLRDDHDAKLLRDNNLTHEHLTELNATADHVRAATQAEDDRPHDGDLVRAVAAFHDTVQEGLAAPNHFLARLLCVVELNLCADYADEAAIASEVLESEAERVEADRRWRARERDPLHHAGRDALAEEEEHFNDAFVRHLAAAVDAFERSQPVPPSAPADHDDL